MKLLKNLIIIFFLSFIVITPLKNVVNASETTSANYKLFETTNMWTFIKLDTRNGKMWQVQYAINDDSARFETILNSYSLAEGWGEEKGRFTLYPTQNMYTFILLDQIDGRMWQVQWSLEPTNRGIVAEIK